MTATARPAARRPRKQPFDLLRAPVIGPFLRWKHARSALQAVLLAISALLLYDGFTGPAIAPKNLAGVVPWVHWRGFLVLALLIAGNLFCMACPFMLPRNLAKRLFPADRPWPKRLQNKWLVIGLLVAFYWAYEVFDLWASPWLTAWIIAAFFVTSFAIDAVFRGAAFCKYVCPIGQFNFVGSLVSPLEVKVRRPATCDACTTKDCIRGTPAPAPALAASASGRALPMAQRGCELWLYQPLKQGNFDCTFCLDCVHACPHDNVGLLARLPGAELWHDRWRSGVGRLGERADVAALVGLLTFGALLNAFGMVGPVYTLEAALAGLLGTQSEAVVLGVVFLVGLGLLPVATVGGAALLSRALGGGLPSLRATAVRYLPSFAPFAFGMWLAHYSFHFFTGFLTFIPVVQNLLLEFGLWRGEPAWGLAQVLPDAFIGRFEVLAIALGLGGTLIALHRTALAVAGERRAVAAFVPWAVLALLLCGFGLWVMSQPMEMRGTFSA